MLFGSTWPLRVGAGHNNTYHPEFKGSFSLKSVLPALVPDLSYDNMEVADGVSAGQAWDAMVRGNPDVSERARVTDALLAYCRQDTLARFRCLQNCETLLTSRHDNPTACPMLSKPWTD